MLVKYHSITNHYRKKDIDNFLSYAKPETQYAVFEKIDGSNVSFLFTKGEKTRYFSRSQEITGHPFYGADDAIQSIIEHPKLNELARDLGAIRLFGELFGPGIQKRVDYGKEKRILFFDVMLQDKLISPRGMQTLFYNYDILDLMIEPLGIYHSFDTAVAYNEEFNTNYGSGLAEGIVIKPWNTCIINQNSSPFYIKKKSAKFADKIKTRIKKEPSIQREEVEIVKEAFMSYINENTVASVFSKEGEIETCNDLGKYIKLVIDDAKDTFFRETDFDLYIFSKEEIRYIFNAGSQVATMLRTNLENFS